MPLIFPLFLAAATPPAARPAAPPAAVAPAPLATTDEEVWALARKVATSGAYKVYLDRFPAGAHAGEAIEAFHRHGGPVIAPPRVIAPSVPASAPADPCIDLIVSQEMKRIDSPEAVAFLAAGRGNRPADYQNYLGHFPAGACRTEAEARLRIRAERRRRFLPISGFGPLAAQPATRAIFVDDDYPMAALRAEERGTVTAEWDVAEDGIVESCRILRSSGSQSLDDATCRIVTARMRYDPARDAAGTPVRSIDHVSIRWILPVDQDLPPAAQAPQPH